MPQGKGTYGSKIGRPPKKYQTGGEVMRSPEPSITPEFDARNRSQVSEGFGNDMIDIDNTQGKFPQTDDIGLGEMESNNFNQETPLNQPGGPAFAPRISATFDEGPDAMNDPDIELAKGGKISDKGNKPMDKTGWSSGEKYGPDDIFPYGLWKKGGKVKKK